MENNNKTAKEEVKVAVPVSEKHVHESHKEHTHTEGKNQEHVHINPENKTHDHAKDKKEVKQVKITKPTVKKDVALVRAPSVHMSKRHGMYICSFIKGKSIDNAIADLEQVIMIKKAVPFKGEIPHRKGKGMMSGRYPVAASKLFIPMLKNLKGSVIFNGMDISKTRISTAYSQWASRPARRGGQKGKRSYITIEAKELKK